MRPSKHTPESYPLPGNLPDCPGGGKSPIDSEDGDPIVDEDDFDALGGSILADAPRMYP